MNRSRWFIPGVVASVVLSLGLGFIAGKRSGVADLAQDPDSAYAQQSEIARLSEELTQARGELEVLRTRHDVDRQTQELLRTEIAGHKEQVGEIQEALRFYRSLMTPDDITTGLSLRVPELIEGDRPGVVLFRIVAQQEARRHKLIEGELIVEVTGSSGGESITLSLAELDKSFSEDAMRLNFRYFQMFEGELEFPEGFKPVEIHILAKALKPQRVEVGQKFPWKLQERMTHVGG